jgi:hypothetical protein
VTKVVSRHEPSDVLEIGIVLFVYGFAIVKVRMWMGSETCSGKR